MKKRYLAVCLIVTLLCSVSAFFLGSIRGSYKGKLNRVMNIIEKYFALPYDAEEIEDAAAKFMVYALDDPYSEYMTKEESSVFFETMSGYYKGIGVVLNYNSEKDEIFVEDTEKDGPADKAGIKAGDILLYVDEIEVKYENYDSVFYYIKGISEEAPEDDTAMKLRVLREGEELEFFVKREELIYDNVESEAMDDILYIKLSEFSENAPSEIKAALEKHKGFSGIVLDLRDNGGGDLNSLMEIAELLLPEGLLLTTENAKGVKTEYSVEDNEYYDMPLAILVNGNTASASEVLSAAVKETERGILVGETTYGKGLVQAIIPLFDGSTLRLTVEKYYTAGGNYINEAGIEPDIEESDDEEQLAKAVEYIKSEI